MAVCSFPVASRLPDCLCAPYPAACTAHVPARRAALAALALSCTPHPPALAPRRSRGAPQIVFSEPTWVGRPEDNPQELPLPLPAFLTDAAASHAATSAPANGGDAPGGGEDAAGARKLHAGYDWAYGAGAKPGEAPR
jgi:hypothetical protein